MNPRRALACLTVLALLGCAAPGDGPSAPEPSRHTPHAVQLPEPPRATASGRPRAVFLGDSLVQGAYGDGERFTAVVAEAKGWEEFNLGRAGTGYHTSIADPERARQVCGQDYCPTFVEMVPQAIAADPDIVVISGGENDLSGDDLTGPVRLMLDNLTNFLPHAQIYVLEPLWQAKPYPAYLRRHADVLRRSATGTVRYVDLDRPLSDCPECFAADGVHPNAEGYRRLGAVVAAKLPDSAPGTPMKPTGPAASPR